METRVVTAHIPEDLAKEVDFFADRLDRPKGWVVKEALTAWVRLEAKRHELTLEGMADVTAGRVVSHDQVKTWSTKLDK